MKKRNNLLFFILWSPYFLFAQEELLPINLDANVINNAESLRAFFGRLDKSGESVVSIFHFGDSHIQADYFSGEIRKQMQQTFGNAGRGFVFPYQQVATNGPKDYSFKSRQHWEVMKLIKTKSAFYCGLAGYTFLIDPTIENRNLDFSFRTDSDFMNNSVRTIQLFYETGGQQPEITAFDAQYAGYAKLLSRKNNSGLTIDSFVFNSPAQQFEINLQGAGPETIFLDGMILSNGENGLIYHSVGVNGAKFTQFNQAPKFMDELGILNPGLVIVSLGTNESAGKYDSLEFIQTLDSLVQKIQYLGATVLLTTPPNNYLPHRGYKYISRKGKRRKVRYKAYEPNENIKLIKDNILSYCYSRHIAYWDLYEVMGGDYSMKEWVKNGKAAKDYLHFTKGGYLLQGNLFYEAFINAYRQYQIK